MPRTNRINLIDRFIASSKRIPARGRVDYWDSQTPGMGLRVSSTRASHLCPRRPVSAEPGG
jgi:hypothetical protein